MIIIDDKICLALLLGERPPALPVDHRYVTYASHFRLVSGLSNTRNIVKGTFSAAIESLTAQEADDFVALAMRPPSGMFTVLNPTDHMPDTILVSRQFRLNLFQAEFLGAAVAYGAPLFRWATPTPGDRSPILAAATKLGIEIHSLHGLSD